MLCQVLRDDYALTGNGPGSDWLLMTDVFVWLSADYHIHNAKLQVQKPLAAINHTRSSFFVLIDQMQDKKKTKNLIVKNLQELSYTFNEKLVGGWIVL